MNRVSSSAPFSHARLTSSFNHTGYSDDEYRLLRANLFERFTKVSTVPSEAPIVRLSVSAHQSSPPLSRSLLSGVLTTGSLRRLAYTIPFMQFTAGFRSFQGVNSFHLFWVTAESLKSTSQQIVQYRASYILRFHDTPSPIIPCTKSDLPATHLTERSQ